MGLRAFQIICDTLGGMLDNVTTYHKKAGGDQPKCHVTFLCEKSDAFCPYDYLQTYLFDKLNCHVINWVGGG